MNLNGPVWDVARAERLWGDPGLTATAIANSLGIAKTSFLRYAQRNRNRFPPRPPSIRQGPIVFDRTMLWVAVRLYEIGETLTTIADRVGVSEPLIARELAKLGYRLRGRGGRSKCRPRSGLAWIQQAPDCDPLDFVAVDDAP